MPKIKIVALCACPVGVAHTYMVADKFEAIAKKLGYDVKVETQGMSGIENKLTKKDLDEALYIVLANDIAIREGERFEPYKSKVLQTTMSELLHNTKEYIEKNIQPKEEN